MSKKIEQDGSIRGSRLQTKVATILILACKLTDSAKSSADILKCTRVTQKEVKRFFRRIQHLVPKVAVVGQSSSKYVEQAATSLELDENATNLCRKTAENIQSAEVLTGKKPATIAGVAMWIILKRIPAEAKKRALPM